MTRTAVARRATVLDPHSATFASFADTLYVGVLVFAAAVPIVTGFAGFATGVELLREARRSDGHVSAREFGRSLLGRVRRHWFSCVVLPVLVLGVLVLDIVALPFMGAGATLSAVIPVVLATVAGAFALRVAGAWRPGMSSRRAGSLAFARMSGDSGGSLLLAGGVLTAGALVTLAPLLALVMAGPLALAAIAVDLRSEESPA